MKEKIQAFMAKRQAKGKRSYEIDMCNGPLLGKILRFAVPLMLSGVLQLFFNAADIVVVGRFTGHTALAAVGSTGALINLLINVFVGLSIGTNVLVARYYGAQDAKQLSETVHTSVLTSLVSGVILIAVGVAFAEPLLTLMGTPEDVLGQAALYMRIYFVGMPAMMLYNFGAAIFALCGRHKAPAVLFDHCGRCKRHFESVLRHCVPSRRGGCCHCDGHFAGDFCGTCDHLPDENERFLPFGAA